VLLVPRQRLPGGKPLVVFPQDRLHGGAHATIRAQLAISVQISTCTQRPDNGPASHRRNSRLRGG
jgi:hypothetical protein